jgi:non-ribosomal peptide synthetase component F
VLRTPDTRLSQLDLLDPSEKTVLLEDFNNTFAEYSTKALCLHELFERQADARPGHPAARFDGVDLTYGELEARANQLAHHLRDLGVGRMW